MTLFNDELPIDNAYDALVGEGKKFADPEALAKSKVESDRFIEQLKREQAQLRADLETRIKYEEFLDKMNSFQSGDNNRGAPSLGQPPSDNNNLPPSVTPQDVERLLEQRDTKKRQEENLKTVRSKLAETLGPNFGSKLKQQAAELDVSEEYLVSVAEQNPKAFFKLVGVEAKTEQSFTPPPRSQFNSDSFKPTGSTGQRNFAYYESIRKDKPTEYWQPRIQNEMMRALETQGDAFYS